MINISIRPDGCPPAFHSSGESCYFYDLAQLKYHGAARTDCQQTYSGDLAIYDTMAKRVPPNSPVFSLHVEISYSLKDFDSDSDSMQL